MFRRNTKTRHGTTDESRYISSGVETIGSRRHRCTKPSHDFVKKHKNKVQFWES